MPINKPYKKRPHRLVFDVSTAAAWHGPPSGIDRLQSRLVGAIARFRPDVKLVVFDRRRERYRVLDDGAFDLAADPRVVIDAESTTWRGRVDFWRSGPRRIAAARAALDTGQYGWGSKTWLRVGIDAVSRRDFAFAAGDLLVDTGAGWEYGAAGIAAALKQAFGIRYVAMCHDVIPLMFPEWCGAAQAASFRRHFIAQSRAADALLFHSRRVADDAQNFAIREGLSAIRGVAVPVGADRLAPEPVAALPPALAAGRYILAVGTIEPRKGHRLLLDSWRRMRAAGVAERYGYTLVFAGKPGWKADEIVAELRREEELDPRFRWLPEVDDALLDRLYRDAAFCVVPSLYEGYGLPAVEASVYGRALLCSTGGALPEVAGALSPCLDPHDVGAWEGMLTRWIAEPGALAAAEARVRAGYRPISWADAARQWIEILDGLA